MGEMQVLTEHTDRIIPDVQTPNHPTRRAGQGAAHPRWWAAWGPEGAGARPSHLGPFCL